MISFEPLTNFKVQTMAGEGKTPNATRDDAYAYLRTVKDKFENDREKYDDFFAIMNNFNAGRYVCVVSVCIQYGSMICFLLNKLISNVT